MKAQIKYFEAQALHGLGIGVVILLLPLWVVMAQPEQDAVFQRLVHEYTLQPDGSIDYHHFRQLNMDSYYAFHRKYGETFIVYNPDNERLAIKEAFTIMADGTRVPLPENALNELLPRYAEGAAPHHGLREMVVTHTGLERGSVIFLDYTIKRFPGFMPYMAGTQVLAEDAPIKDLTFILRVPDGITLHHKMHNVEVHPELIQANGMTEYRWNLKDIPALNSPPFSASPFYRVPSIVFSTARDMESVREGFLSQEAFTFSAGMDIKIAADSLSAESTSDLLLALSLQEKLHASIRTWSVGLKDAGYKVRTADEVWNTAGGTPLEKAILLTTLCRAAGLKAYPIASIERILFDKGIGLPDVFENTLVRVALKDRIIYLNPIGLSSFSEDLAVVNKYLIPLDPGERMLEKPGPDIPAQINVKLDMTFIPGQGLTADMNLVTRNAACPEFVLQKGEDPWKVMGKMEGYALEKMLPGRKDDQICEKRFQLRNTEKLKQYGNYTFIRWPVPAIPLKGFSAKALTSSENMPSILPHGLEIEHAFELTLPPGYRMAMMEVQDEVRNEAGHYRISLSQQKNKVVFSRSLKLSAIILKDREGFVELVNQWLSPSWDGIFIVKE